MKYYFAYGSNLNMGAMQRRCPAAVPIRSHRLHGWRLVFRGVADIERAQGKFVDGFIFGITARCERALDRYEGFPHAYVKGVFRSRNVDGARRKVMFYVMPNSRRYGNGGEVLPPEHYLRTIVQGFFDCGLEVDSLEPAIKSAADCQEAERERYVEPDEFEFIEDEDMLDARAEAEREQWEFNERQLPLRFRSKKKVRTA